MTDPYRAWDTTDFYAAGYQEPHGNRIKWKWWRFEDGQYLAWKTGPGWRDGFLDTDPLTGTWHGAQNPAPEGME